MSRERHGDWASWAPSGRGAVPVIVLLVNVANLVGVATVTLLLIGVSGDSDGGGRAAVLWTALRSTVGAPRRPPSGGAWLHRRRAAGRPAHRDAPAPGHQRLAHGRPRPDDGRGRTGA